MSIFTRMKIKNRKKRVTFEDIAKEWLQSKKRTIKESSYANYSYTIKKYLIPQLHGLNLYQLERNDYNSFIDDLLQNLEPKTVKDIIVKLKSILYYAEIEYNCNMKFKKIISPKQKSKTFRILSKREKGRLEKKCLTENNLKSYGVILGLNTGMRIGEICSLKWKNINLDKREIYVNSTLQRIYRVNQKRTEIIRDTPKSNSSVRSIPISSKLYEILKELKKNYKDEDYFLTGDKEKFIEPRNYQNTFKEILKKSKIGSKYTFHILRHTFATNCIEVGMDVKSLSEMLGHSSVEITLNRYVHSSYKIKKKFLEKL